MFTRLRTSLTIVVIIAAIKSGGCPADRTPFTTHNADGSAITLILNGDESYSFITTTDGYTIQRNNRGNYVYVVPRGTDLEASQVVAHDIGQRTTQETAFLSTIEESSISQLSNVTLQSRAAKSTENLKRIYTPAERGFEFSSFKGLVILVEFADRKFSRPDVKELFDAAFNDHDFNGFDNLDGSRRSILGGVSRYFHDNSAGVFVPHWEVVGPYDTGLSCLMGRNDQPSICLKALELADMDVDFTQFDGNGDGIVDNVIFINAGYSSHYSGNNSSYLWPHAYLPSSSHIGIYDGMMVRSRANITELAGNESDGGDLMMISVALHEFSHCLGLPDLYNGSNLYQWDLMHGVSPVYYSTVERRDVFGFEPTEIDPSIDSVYCIDRHGTQNDGYIIHTHNSDECLLLENRQRNTSRWEGCLPGHGLLISRLNGDLTRNNIRLIRAGNSTASSSQASDPFPGTMNVTRLDSIFTHDNKLCYFSLRDIRETDSKIYFRVVPRYKGLIVNDKPITGNAELQAECALLREAGILNAESELAFFPETRLLKMKDVRINLADGNNPFISLKGVDDFIVEIEGDCRLTTNNTPLEVVETALSIKGAGSLTLESSTNIALKMFYSGLDVIGGVSLVAKGATVGISGEMSTLRWHDNDGFKPTTLRAYGGSGSSLAVTELNLTDEYIITEPAGSVFAGGRVCRGSDAVTGEWVTIEQARLPFAIGGEQVYLNRDSAYWDYFTVRLKLLGRMLRGYIAYDHGRRTLKLENAWLRIPDVNTIANGLYSHRLHCDLEGISNLRIAVGGDCVIECAEGCVPLSLYGGDVTLTGNGTLRLISDTSAIDLQSGSTLSLEAPTIEIVAAGIEGAIAGDTTATVNIKGGKLAVTTTQGPPFAGIACVNLEGNMRLTQPFGAYLDGAIVRKADGQPAVAGHYFFGVTGAMAGDVTGNGTVNVADIVAMVNFLLGDVVPGFVNSNADVNGDGRVNVVDVVAIVNMTLEN